MSDQEEMLAFIRDPENIAKAAEGSMDKRLAASRPSIDLVIQRIRDSFEGSTWVYTRGSCYHFARILEAIFPEGMIVDNVHHAVFYYEDKFWDISGEVSGKMRHEGVMGGHLTYSPAEHPTRHGKWSLMEEMRKK